MSIPQWMIDEVKEYDTWGIHPGTVLDIGANFGQFTQFALNEWPECRITAYEPVSGNAERFRENIKSDRVSFFQVGVRSESKNDVMIVDPIPTRSKFTDLSTSRSVRATEKVGLVCASSIPSHELVKIDTEGCEVEILYGLDLSKTRWLLLECHDVHDLEAMVSTCGKSGLFIKSLRVNHQGMINIRFDRIK